MTLLGPPLWLPMRRWPFCYSRCPFRELGWGTETNDKARGRDWWRCCHCCNVLPNASRESNSKTYRHLKKQSVAMIETIYPNLWQQTMTRCGRRNPLALRFSSELKLIQFFFRWQTKRFIPLETITLGTAECDSITTTLSLSFLAGEAGCIASLLQFAL
jgi:hypothetical protein